MQSACSMGDMEFGMSNPNLPCCHSCGVEGAPESFVLYRLELVCSTCYEEHERKAEADSDHCDDCGVTHVQLIELCCGAVLCPGCVTKKNETMAERAEHAANESYYGGGFSAETYARNANKGSK